MLGADVAETDRLETAGVAGVAVVVLFRLLLPRHLDLLGIDDDDEIAHVHVRRDRSASSCRATLHAMTVARRPKRLALGIDDEPLSADVARLRRTRPSLHGSFYSFSRPLWRGRSALPIRYPLPGVRVVLVVTDPPEYQSIRRRRHSGPSRRSRPASNSSIQVCRTRSPADLDQGARRCSAPSAAEIRPPRSAVRATPAGSPAPHQGADAVERRRRDTVRIVPAAPWTALRSRDTLAVTGKVGEVVRPDQPSRSRVHRIEVESNRVPLLTNPAIERLPDPSTAGIDTPATARRIWRETAAGLSLDVRAPPDRPAAGRSAPSASV